MKIIERISLTLFSSLILIISVILCLTIFGWLDTNTVGKIINTAITGDITSKVLLGLSIIFILLAIRCIFFESTDKTKEEYKNGILLENENGKLLITRERYGIQNKYFRTVGMLHKRTLCSCHLVIRHLL